MCVVGLLQERLREDDLLSAFIERVLGKLGFKIQLDLFFLNTTLNVIFSFTYYLGFTRCYDFLLLLSLFQSSKVVEVL